MLVLFLLHFKPTRNDNDDDDDDDDDYNYYYFFFFTLGSKDPEG